MPYPGVRNDDCLGVKEEPYRDFVEVDKYIWPILHNQINLGNNIFYNLLDYGDEYMENLSFQKNIARNSLLAIDSSIDEN